MFHDTRLANNPRWFLDKPKDWAMRVPDHLLNNVVFVGYSTRDPLSEGEKFYWLGTAFFVSVPCADRLSSFTYLVTVKHISDKLVGKKWFIRFNTKDGKSEVAEGADSVKWWKHPTEEESVDLAVMPWCPPDNADVTYTPISMFATDSVIQQQYIGVGDEVFYTGLFTRHTGKERNLPILRTGNVAMMPVEKIEASIDKYQGPIDAYLIEVRSMGGLSGSPVFVRETLSVDFPLTNKQTAEVQQKTLPVHGRYYLLGMMHGHWNIHPSEHNRQNFRTTSNVSESIALGISIIVPAKKILEVINQPELAERRARFERERSELRGTTSVD